MPIISKETWDKLSQEEKTIIQNRYRYYNDNNDSRYNREIEIYNEFFGKENLQPKPLTYEDVARELFKGKDVACIDSDGEIDGFYCTLPNCATKPNVCTSIKQAEKLLAINKLLNVAKFLNKDWKPDWSNGEEEKFYIGIDNSENKKLIIKKAWFGQYEIIYFRTEELAEQAVTILGEDTVRLALTSDF